MDSKISIFLLTTKYPNHILHTSQPTGGRTITRIITIIAILAVTSIASAETRREFRDQFGNLRATWESNGSHTNVRDQYGNLIGTRDRHNNRIDLRDQYGNYVGDESIEEDR